MIISSILFSGLDVNIPYYFSSKLSAFMYVLMILEKFLIMFHFLITIKSLSLFGKLFSLLKVLNKIHIYSWVY
jgi:hypothetical protein